MIAGMSAFGALLAQLMELRGFTVRSFGDAVKSSKSTISGVVNDTRTPPLDDMDRWCETLGLRGADKVRFTDLASLAHLPKGVRERFETWYDEHQTLKTDYADLLRQVRRAAEK